MLTALISITSTWTVIEKPWVDDDERLLTDLQSVSKRFIKTPDVRHQSAGVVLLVLYASMLDNSVDDFADLAQAYAEDKLHKNPSHPLRGTDGITI